VLSLEKLPIMYAITLSPPDLRVDFVAFCFLHGALLHRNDDYIRFVALSSMDILKQQAVPLL
jgi:hypothetical protein